MKRTAELTVTVLLTFLFLPTLALSQPVFLTILHTNDTHGHLTPFSYPSFGPAGSEVAALSPRTDIGGIARRATLVKLLREELSNNGTTVWLVDSGDFTDGTPFSTEYHGEADIAAMNAADYTFGALGNHEFNNPLPRLKSLITRFRYPILCANATDKSTGRLLAQACQIRQVGPLKVGVFGLVTSQAAEYRAAKEGVIISGEIETSRQMVKALRPAADVVVAISHAGERVDQQIAAAVPGVDIIIGGHSHSRLPAGELVAHRNELTAERVTGTIIVQAHQWGGELGRLDLSLDKDERDMWHVNHYRASLIPVTPDIPDDPAVAKVVERYWKPIASRYEEVVGRADDDFVERGDDLAQYNLVADSVRETFGAEIELENVGGVRALLAKGQITLADLVEMDPFDNTVVIFRVAGSKLKEILQTHRPAVSGLRYRIEKGKAVEVTVAGQTLKEDRTYRGATNSYFAGVALKGVPVTDTGKRRLQVLTEWIRSSGSIEPRYDGRRVVQ